MPNRRVLKSHVRRACSNCQDYRLSPVSAHGVIQAGEKYLRITYFPKESAEYGPRKHTTFQSCESCARKGGTWPTP
jgi:hypothetical protein